MSTIQSGNSSDATNPSSNKVLERQAALKAEFSGINSWEDRYKRLIDYGKSLPKLPAELYDEKYKVRGCQSQVWLHANLNPDQSVHLSADSDALIVKGLVAILLKVYSEAKPEEILSASADFLKELGFEGHLSPSRTNGFYAMLKQILYYAQAFQALAKLQKQ
jgi:cysteine desulfuration protein SufE